MMRAINDRFTFLSKFIQEPTQIGSLTPSSSFLTKKMFKNISWQNVDAIVELGAGTGVFTHFIDARKEDKTEAIIIEKDEQMRSLLEQLYPHFHFDSDAEKFDARLRQLGIDHVDCVISGLPFANFSNELRETIINTVVDCLKPGGLFIAFQYSLQMRSMLENRFSNVTIDFEARNLPPAFIYTCKK